MVVRRRKNTRRKIEKRHCGAKMNPLVLVSTIILRRRRRAAPSSSAAIRKPRKMKGRMGRRLKRKKTKAKRNLKRQERNASIRIRQQAPSSCRVRPSLSMADPKRGCLERVVVLLLGVGVRVRIRVPRGRNPPMRAWSEGGCEPIASRLTPNNQSQPSEREARGRTREERR